MAKTRTRRKGSALIFVVCMMIAITSVVVTTSELNVATGQKAERQISDAKADETFNGQVALVKSLCKSNNIAVPTTSTITLNGMTVTANITDNSGVTDRTYLVAQNETTAFKSYVYSAPIGGRQLPHPFYYALAVGHDLDVSDASLTVNNGSVYSGHDAKLSAASTIDGQLQYGNNYTANGATVGKDILNGGVAPSIPAVNRPQYSVAAGGILNILDLLNITLLGGVIGGYYPIDYHNKSTNIRGTITGSGTVFIAGNATVTGNLTYANGASRVVFIVDGNLTVNTSVSQMDGMWYVTGNVQNSNTATPLTIGRGALTVQGDIKKIGRPLVVNFDSVFAYSRDEAAKFRTPGFWPSPDPNLVR